MSLHQLVIEATARYPRRPAVACGTGVWSYADLDRRANALAARMRAAGVGRGDRVVIAAEKSLEVVAAMQAALRLGAAYVPVDPAMPLARAAAVVRDCEARLICASGSWLEQWLAEHGRTGPYLDLAGAGWENGPPAEELVNEAVDPDELAYILYTSGSTGRPKGVCISHRNARAFIDWAAAELNVAPSDRFANHAALTFDLSVLDLYAAFAGGAMVYLVPHELAYAPRRLVELLHEQRISIWYSVPSALTLMIREGALLDRPAPAALRALLFAGEPFPIAQVRRLAAWTPARLLNLYGPTETNVSAHHEVQPSDLERERPVPIGVAASGDRIWAVTPDGGRALVGQEGELWVDGPTVMLGYWGSEPHRGPYATGDIVRLLPDGAFDYVGRRDLMVKVRGYRVELGEVESALAAHPDIEEAAVVATGSGVDTRLEAFVVPSPGRAPGVLTLKRHIAERLPSYMIADRIHLVAMLPRTANGKVDRAALATHESHQSAGAEMGTS